MPITIDRYMSLIVYPSMTARLLRVSCWFRTELTLNCIATHTIEFDRAYLIGTASGVRRVLRTIVVLYRAVPCYHNQHNQEI